MNESVSWSSDTFIILLYIKRQVLVETHVSQPFHSAGVKHFYYYYTS